MIDTSQIPMTYKVLGKPNVPVSPTVCVQVTCGGYTIAEWTSSSPNVFGTMGEGEDEHENRVGKLFEVARDIFARGQE